MGVSLGTSRRVSVLIFSLTLITAWAALWPACRAFVNVEIDSNEGWNAYYADAAMGRMPLYPSRDQLITNNYPPLSFYLVGGLGQLIGDVVLAGRLLSLASVALIGLMAAVSIQRLGGNRTAACVGGLYFVATMCRFFNDYVGMNDPHLLGLAVMTVGFALFLRANGRNRGYAIAFFVMIVAGFIKHTLMAIPLTSLIWLGVHRPMQMVRSGLRSVAVIGVGFGLCFAAFGPDFFANLMSPRGMNWRLAVGATGRLQWVAVGLIAAVYVGLKRRDDPGVRLCSLLTAIALVNYFIEKAGAGVADNAQFELVFAVSIGVGLAFAHAAMLSLPRWQTAEAVRFVLLLAVCLRLVASTRLEPVRLVADPGFRQIILAHEAAMATTVARIRTVPGAVLADPLACYEAGKPFVVDVFNCPERMKTGNLPADAISSLLAMGKLTVIKQDPRLSWSGRSRAANQGEPGTSAIGVE